MVALLRRAVRKPSLCLPSRDPHLPSPSQPHPQVIAFQKPSLPPSTSSHSHPPGPLFGSEASTLRPSRLLHTSSPSELARLSSSNPVALQAWNVHPGAGTSTMAYAQAVGPMAHQQLLLPSRQVKIGFIGAGQMAEAMAKSWHVSGVVPAASMFCTDVSLDRRRVFESFGVTSLDNSRQVAEKSDVLILAVKPPGVKPVLTELRSVLEERHLIVSIAAGVTISSMQAWAGQNVRMVRVMPNTACIVGATASAMSAGPKATPADACLVRSLFAAVGTIHEVPETLLDAVTGLSGSGPAYVFMLIEAMADGGVASGLPRDMAVSLAAQTAFGASKMVLETGKHPAQLKDSVSSPQGTTIAGVHELEKGGFRAAVMNAVMAATNRSRELSNVNSVNALSLGRPRKLMKVMKPPDPNNPQASEGGEGVASGLDFDGDRSVEGLEGAMQMVSGDEDQGELRRKSRIVVCKQCGGNHYRKTACRGPPPAGEGQ